MYVKLYCKLITVACNRSERDRGGERDGGGGGGEKERRRREGERGGLNLFYDCTVIAHYQLVLYYHRARWY